MDMDRQGEPPVVTVDQTMMFFEIVFVMFDGPFDLSETQGLS